MTFDSIKVKSTYTITCGYFSLKNARIKVNTSAYVDWTTRVPEELHLVEYLNSIYYDNYLEKVLSSKSAKHLTYPNINSAECSLKLGDNNPVFSPCGYRR